MAIVRVFRVKIDLNLRDEFECKFETISVESVKSRAGFLGETIYKPSKWTPDEYAMISHWESEAALEAFAGANWREAVIPPEMSKYALDSWVHHYEAW